MLFAVGPLFQVRVEDGRRDRRLMSGQIEGGTGVQRRARMTMRCSDLWPQRHSTEAGIRRKRRARAAPVRARSIRRVCVRRLVVSRKAHFRGIFTSIAAPVLISVYGELIRRSHTSKRFSSPHRR
jgi:hypothetical protein